MNPLPKFSKTAKYVIKSLGECPKPNFTVPHQTANSLKKHGIVRVCKHGGLTLTRRGQQAYDRILEDIYIKNSLD